MKSYCVACLASAMVGLVIGGWIVEDYPELSLSATARAGQDTVPADTRADRVDTSSEDLTQYTSEEMRNIRVYEAANASVVNISTQSVHHDRFFGLEGTSEGSGSGSVIDKEGHILTNFHVVDGARQIEVTLAGGKSYLAEIVGFDKIDDLAVLKIDAPSTELQPIVFGESSSLKVGQRVYVLGNPFGWERTMTTGIISGLNRALPSRTEYRTMKALIQTDAAMNPGNSGGPLLDNRARMIGMNVAIAMSDARQNSGVGFAIPVNRIKRQVRELIESGKVTRGDLGITHVMPVDQGIIVGRVVDGGPAQQAGLRPIRVYIEERQHGLYISRRPRIDISSADIITAIDGQPVKSAGQFVEAIESRKPGETVTLSLLREGKAYRVEVTLGAS